MNKVKNMFDIFSKYVNKNYKQKNIGNNGRMSKFRVEKLEDRFMLSSLVDKVPSLDWLKYFGRGVYDDYGENVLVDSFNNIYLVGTTETENWISGGYDTTFNGSSDAFVAKLNSNGEHIWSTYIGGDNWDYGDGITIDNFGDIYVVGTTAGAGWVSGGVDTSFNGNWDVFLAKLNSSGEHLWSSYIGGGGYDSADGITTDGNNIYITGNTMSGGWISGGYDTSFNGDSDGFVAKLNSSGEHLWSTYVGGSEYDEGSDVTIDSSNNIYVTGTTTSANWVSSGYDTNLNGGQDAFVVKISSLGGHIWSSYLGGDNLEIGNGITTDGNNIYVTGITKSTDWISVGYDTSYNGIADAFLAKFNSSGEHVWSTYLGGLERDEGQDISLDSSNNIYVTGSTFSSDWTSGGFDSILDGASDVFIAKINPIGQHIWSSYLGESNEDHGEGIVVDNSDNIIITGWTDPGIGINDEILLARITNREIRAPVLVVPGILGSLVEGRNTLPGHINGFIRNVRLVNRKIVLNNIHPYVLAPERIENSYQEIIDSFLERGYSLCDPDNPRIIDDTVNCGSDANLFFAAYDWRQPVLVNPNDPTQLLWDNNPRTFKSGVEYLEFWINLAKEKFIAKYGSENENNFAVDVVSHSMGGLVARAYIEEAEEAGRAQTTSKVNKLVMLGTPNHGVVAIYTFLDPFKGVVGGTDLKSILLDSTLRRYLRESIVNVENRFNLRRGTVKAEDLVPSLIDLLPTFPFYVRNGSLTIPRRNYLLERLNNGVNNGVDDLVNATDVLLIGTKNLATPIRIVADRNNLRFVNRNIGDGRTLYHRAPGVDVPAGQVIPDSRIEKVSVLDVKHGDLPQNQAVISRVIDEILTSS